MSQESLFPDVREPVDSDSGVTLVLHVTDAEVAEALLEREEGLERDAFAMAALKIGVIAMRRIQGQLDADLIRSEREQLVDAMTGTVRDWFDPENGRFNERVTRLIGNDGELADLMRRQVGPDGSTLARTLENYVGEGSPLLELFSTDDSEGFLSAMSEVLEDRLETERKHILGQFTLDDETSALSRLVRHVRGSQSELAAEFSLDREDSALSRLRRDLTSVLEAEGKRNQDFRTLVESRLEAMAARKKESLRSTVHGDEFEDAAVGVVLGMATETGDIGEATGTTHGLIRNCKVGDAVVRIGPEAAGAGARLAFEMKEDQSYTVAKALGEIETARKNRSAEIGVFVFSARTAPAEIEGLARFGDDILVVWNQEDPATDVWLKAAFSIARALAAGRAGGREVRDMDIDGMERAIRAIEKQADQVAQITTWTSTIRSNADKILERVRVATDDFERQIELLDERVAEVRDVLAQESGT